MRSALTLARLRAVALGGFDGGKPGIDAAGDQSLMHDLARADRIDPLAVPMAGPGRRAGGSRLDGGLRSSTIQDFGDAIQ